MKPGWSVRRRSFKLRYLGRQGCMPNVTRNAFQLAYEGGASVGFRTDAIDGGPGCGAEGKQEDACRRKEEVRDRGREQSVQFTFHLMSYFQFSLSIFAARPGDGPRHKNTAQGEKVSDLCSSLCLAFHRAKS